MALLPEHKNPIENAIESKQYLSEKRDYLGMSGVGSSCHRKTWYQWRWFSSVFIPAKLKRIFERGDLEEPRIVKDLESIGVMISDDQLEIVDSTGHCRGHIDSLAKNVLGAEKTTHLAEFKTMKNSKFNKFKKDIETIGFDLALMQFSSAYWVQIQAYMGYLDLTRCLYVVTNKDNEERIYARVKFNKEHFTAIKKLILKILTSTTPPKRISEREDWYACKLCDYKNVCFGHVQPEINCRTCKFSTPEDDGVWTCKANDYAELSVSEQLNGCEKHQHI